MPASNRRASAAANHPPTSNSTRGNVHRTAESQHVSVGTLHGGSGISVFNPQAHTPQQKVIGILVDRLKAKLPYYSGMTVVDFEQDEAVRQIIGSLRHLSCEFPDFMAWTLANLLDNLAQTKDSDTERIISGLQSQLVVLKILCVTMAARWTTEERTNGDALSSGLNTPVEASSPTFGRPSLARPSRETIGSPTFSSSELPPLREECAKYILSVMVLFMRQTSPNESGDHEVILSHHDFEVDNVPRVVTDPRIPPDAGSHPPPRPTHAVRSRASNASFGSSVATKVPTAIPIPSEARHYTPTPSSMARSISSLNAMIGKYAGIAVYHLSASNWQVVFARVRSKIHALEKIERGAMPDVIDLQLMTECALDRARLVQLLQEISSLYMTMKRDAQLVLAPPLASAIWHWIDLYPEEFADAVSISRRLDGAPDRVFDLMYRQMQSESRHLEWPTLTILMCISYERVNQDFNIDAGGGGARKTNKKEVMLVDSLVKGTGSSNPRIATVALRCLLDIGKAASRVGSRETPLRSFAYDIAHEVHTVLFKSSGQRPFWESSGEIDVAIYADALVLMWRFFAEPEAISLFRKCLQPERSDAVKLCAVTAMHTLAQEAPRFLDQRPPNALWIEFAVRLRSIFQHASSRKVEFDNGSFRQASALPKSKGYATQRLADREILLVALLALWRADVAIYCLGLPDVITEREYLSLGTVVWDNENEAAVKLAMSKSYKCLLDTAFLMQPGDPFVDKLANLLPKLTPQYIFTACSHLFQCRLDYEVQEMWITELGDLLKTYVRDSVHPHTDLIQQAPERKPAFIISEIICLVALTSFNNKVAMTAAQSLRTLAQAERETGIIYQTSTGEDEGALRLEVYEQLGDPKIVVMGRVAYQKRIRKLLSRLVTATPRYYAVWQECYFRWTEVDRLYMQTLEKDIEDGRNAMTRKRLKSEDMHQQWRNLTLFLAALGAACTPAEPYDHEALFDIVPTQYMTDMTKTLQSPEHLVDAYLERLADQLISRVVSIRDVARDALGMELTTKLYPRLHKFLDRILHELLSNEDVGWKDNYTIFLDQFVSLFKVILENSTASIDGRANANFGNTLLQLSGFMGRYNSEFAPMRARIKFCSLTEMAAKRIDATGLIRRETFSGHEILEMLTVWVKDPASLEPEPAQLQRELNLACLPAVVNILERCPLPPDNSMRGGELEHHNTRFGFRYFELLVRIMEFERNRMDDDGTSSQTSQSQRTKAARVDAQTRELVTMGHVHITSANASNMVKHSFDKAFHEDLETRIGFVLICARALRKGAKIDATRPQAEGVTPTQRLLDLVKKPNLTLAIAICETCPASDVDVIIPVLFNVFDTRSSLVQLLKVLINREIDKTDSEAELFRGNSMCTRMLSHFGKIHGYYYLRQLIRSLVEIMTAAPLDCYYELDPERVGQEVADKNMATVKTVATSFLEIIQDSVAALPSMFREVCAHIAQQIQLRYPEAKFAALGAFIFLRFISPAIVSPEIVDIQLPRDERGSMRKGLMIIAKIIQNLANNMFFGKEAHMVVLNEYLRDNIVIVTRYLSELNKYVPPMSVDSGDEWLGTACDESDILVLHRFFEKHIDKLGKEILSIEKGREQEGPAPVPSTLWNDLCEAIVETSHPNDPPQLSTETSKDHGAFLDLMDRFADRSVAGVQNVFVESMTEHDQPALFVLTMGHLDVETMDMDLLLYHILKTLLKPTDQQRDFEIIVDFTGFSARSEVPLQWLKYCMEIVPMDVRHHLISTHMLNPNLAAQRYLRRLYNIASAALGPSANLLMYITVDSLRQQVPAAVDAPLKEASKLEEEPCHEFAEVGIRQASQYRILANIRVAASHLRITSLKGLPISPGLLCKTVDIIDLADVSDVYNVSLGHEAHEFIIRQRHGTIMYLNSPDRDTIVKAIRDARGKLRGVRLAVERGSKQQTNLHACLLMIGMADVIHTDYDLRIAAMDLLEALCSALGVEDAMDVSTRAVVPYNPTIFIANLNAHLAHNLPYLTIDFITEVCTSLEKQPTSARIHSLQNLSPWIINLQQFCNPAHPLFETSGARLRDCVRTLVDLTTNDHELVPIMQKHVWQEIAKSDTTFTNVVLEELMRAAVDAGVSTRRCAVIGETVATLSSVAVRGRLLAKTRKVFSKTTMRATQNLAENMQWGEIAAMTSLILASGVHYSHQSQLQLFLPELAHVVTHVAATGELLVRRTVHAIVINIIQGLQSFATDEGLRASYRDLLTRAYSEDMLQCFGLRRHAIGEFAEWDPAGPTARADVIALNLREDLTRLMLSIMDVASSSQGLLNVWKARWMSLVISTSFQHSPCIQSRTFAVIGVLATGDVDDDLLYQMLVAFKQGLAQTDETRTAAVVSMLRCITRVVPFLTHESKYLPYLFWLGFALVQSAAIALYEEATRLMQKSLETLERTGAFISHSVSAVLLDAREPLLDVAEQLDEILGLTFHYHFSFVLVAPVFKGYRVKTLQDATESLLRSLLQITSRAQRVHDRDTVSDEALGFFLALLPSVKSNEAFSNLLRDANLSPVVIADHTHPGSATTPQVRLDLFGPQDKHSILAITTFICATLRTAQGDDEESEMLYGLLADIAEQHPEQVSIVYGSLQERISDSFTKSMKPVLLAAATRVFRAAVQEVNRTNLGRPSTSTLNTINEDDGRDANRQQMDLLDELGLSGLVNPLGFLRPGEGHATTMIRWIPDLVQRIISLQ